MAGKAIAPKHPDGVLLGNDATDKIGFFGETPTTKPDITGARDDGTALAALLTALETMGLITDSTTAS